MSSPTALEAELTVLRLGDAPRAAESLGIPVPKLLSLVLSRREERRRIDDLFERFALLVLSPHSATAVRRVRELPKRDRLALVPHLRLWGLGHPNNASLFGLSLREWREARHVEEEELPESLRHFFYWAPRSETLRKKIAASPKEERLPFVSIMRNAGVPLREIGEFLSLTRDEVFDEATKRR